MCNRNPVMEIDRAGSFGSSDGADKISYNCLTLYSWSIHSWISFFVSSLIVCHHLQVTHPPRLAGFRCAVRNRSLIVATTYLPGLAATHSINVSAQVVYLVGSAGLFQC